MTNYNNILYQKQRKGVLITLNRPQRAERDERRADERARSGIGRS